jgi:L-lactate dehydrogenase complex protein LldE
MVRNHYDAWLSGAPGFDRLRRGTFELCEFLTDVLKVGELPGRYPHKVGLHQSCHGLRELRLGSSSERVEPRYDKVALLLSQLEGIELVPLTRPDECCGFGGTFAVVEEAVSCLMGALLVLPVALLIGLPNPLFDRAPLVHLDGLARRTRLPLRFRHVAEVLAEATA